MVSVNVIFMSCPLYHSSMDDLSMLFLQQNGAEQAEVSPEQARSSAVKGAKALGKRAQKAAPGKSSLSAYFSSAQCPHY